MAGCGTNSDNNWTASNEFGTYRLCEQRRFRRACASAQPRQNLRCSLIQAVSQEEPSDRKPDLWPLWMAGLAQLKFVMAECSKTQIGLTGLSLYRHYLILQIMYQQYWKKQSQEYDYILLQITFPSLQRKANMKGAHAPLIQHQYYI